MAGWRRQARGWAKLAAWIGPEGVKNLDPAVRQVFVDAVAAAEKPNADQQKVWRESAQKLQGTPFTGVTMAPGQLGVEPVLEVMDPPVNMAGKTAEAAYPNPEYWRAYPQLKGTRVVAQQPMEASGSNGSYSPSKNEIRVTINRPFSLGRKLFGDTPEKTLAHEVSHLGSVSGERAPRAKYSVVPPLQMVQYALDPEERRAREAAARLEMPEAERRETPPSFRRLLQ